MGIPVGELVDRIEVEELVAWTAFERVHGPVLLHDRIDAAFARLTQALVGGSAADHMPDWDSASAPPSQSPEQMVAFLKRLQRQKGRK